MIIKQSIRKSSWAQKLGKFFKKRALLMKALLGAGSLAALALLFLAALGYGAYLAKESQEAYAKPVLLKIAEMDFSFLNDTEEERAVFESLSIEIPGNRLAEIEKLREQALREGKISQAIKDIEFSAALTYRGTTHDVKISLTGAMAMHLKDPNKWSLQVKVPGEDAVDGMKRFNLLLPSTGGYLTDWLGLEVMKERDLRSLQGDFVKLWVNGKSNGVVYLQERFDNDLALDKRFGEGVLFEIGDDLSVYQEDKLMLKPQTESNVLQLRQKWQDLRAGDLALEEFFDLGRMSKLYAICDFMNQKRPAVRKNLSFYYNPLSGLAEPVAREFKDLNDSDHARFVSFLQESDTEGKWHNEIARDPILGTLLDDKDFKRAYIQELEALSPIEYVDSLLFREGKKLNALLKGAYRDWPAYDLPTQALYGNQRYIRDLIFPDKVEINAWFEKTQGNQVSVRLQNQQDLPIDVAYLNWRDTIFFLPNDMVVLEGRAGMEEASPQTFNFEIPSYFSWADSLIPELKVGYNMLGLKTGGKSALVFPWAYDEIAGHSKNPAARESNHTAFAFIEEKADEDVLFIPPGQWKVEKDLIIPPKKRLVVAAGAQIDLLKEAKMICYSPIFCEGTEENPVLFHSSDTTSKGVVIIRAGMRSRLSYAIFDYLSCPQEDGWALPGALTFYESPVDIVNCTFSNNQVGDDFLNIFRTDFTIDKTHFKNINADAFDCDFCEGTVTNSTFVHIGNDGVDVSGTEIEISDVFMDYVSDKGLSAGENSNMIARRIEVHNSEIGVTSKDRSTVILSDSKLINTRIGITLFMKKTEFGPAFATAERIEIQQAEIPFLIEENSSLTLDGKIVPTNKENVKQILYGAEYGKSSR